MCLFPSDVQEFPEKSELQEGNRLKLFFSLHIYLHYSLSLDNSWTFWKCEEE